ncbi:hypothetical protein K1719_030312 [Acacia pycnantha]|nr:hypothetical protein K1719_030312 [Acacia pycnantha]
MTTKMGVVLFLMALSATVEADETVNDNGGGKYHIKSTTTACCNICPCTRSIPPQCHCQDIAETCHSACKACACTRSIPPQCRCFDTTNFCYPSCS